MTGTCEPALAGDSGVSCNVPCEVECAPAQRCADPQEYIFDGGDRDPQVRLREDLTQTGLDPEDTVIQYTTKTGVTEVQSGCRVAIYAPRFGSVRKRTGILTTDLALRPQAAILPNGPVRSSEVGLQQLTDPFHGKAVLLKRNHHELNFVDEG